MHRQELTDEDAIRIVAGMIRNFAAGYEDIISPYAGLDLVWGADNILYRTDVYAPSHARPRIPIGEKEELLSMSDEELYNRVVHGKRANI